MDQNFSLKQLPRWVFPVVAVILLFTIGSALRSAGWSQGFAMGLLAGNAGEGAMTPYLAYQAGHGLHPLGFIGGFFGMLFKIGFFLLIFGMFAKFLGFCRWHRNGGHHGEGHSGEQGWKHTHGPRWGHHGPGGHWGQQPPQQQQPSQQPAQPEQASSTPGNESAEDVEIHKPQQTGWTQV